MTVRRAAHRPSRIFRAGDIRETVLHGLATLVVRSLAPPSWIATSNVFGRLSANNSRSRLAKFRRAVSAVLGEDDAEIAARIYRRSEVQFERRRLYISALHAGVRWSPSIELIGLEHVSRSRPGGTILWFDSLVHFPVISKMAFAEAGYPFWHLSSHQHGFSATAYGVRFLNPRQIGVERPLLQGRIAFDDRSLVSATRRILEVLESGGIVGITNNASLGNYITVPFGETAKLSVATTPLKMALRKQAALLLVSVLETEPLAGYRVTIRPAPAFPPSEQGDPIASAASEYAKYLLPLVRDHPEQWLGWRSIIVS
jgi:hypothetical protein